jgi:rhodanese-related sulfurtransferase
VDFFSNPTNLMLLALALLSGGLLAWPALTRRHHALSPAEATHLINQRHAVIIDIRPKDDFAMGHLPKAKHIPFDILTDKINALTLNKETPVIVVCNNGIQSARACAIIQKAGYPQVGTLADGIQGWQKAGLPLIK